MKSIYIVFIFVILTGDLFARQKEDIPTLENPMSVRYLKKNLKKAHPQVST